MEDLQYGNDDCIFALATPWGKGAIGLIRVSGVHSLELLEKLFSKPKKLSRAKGHTLVHGTIIDPENGNPLDEVLIAVFKGDKSYTGQDTGEIMCHGSLPGIRSILDLLRKNGFRDAGPGEFTMRAFLNGKMDLTRAEAVNELISAKTQASHQLALNRLEGGIYARIESLKQDLLTVSAEVELQLDYPEDEIDFESPALPGLLKKIRIGLSELLSTYSTGKLYRDGLRVALVGPTNAGKSSLFNLFVKEDRAIVSDIHGTTRDYLTEILTLRGIPVTLVDTAGLREVTDSVESRGIERTKHLISNSDIVLFVWDSTIALDTDAFKRVSDKNARVIGVWNKIDIDGHACPDEFVPVSASTGQGFNQLEEAVLACIKADTQPVDAGTVIDSDRQKVLLEEAVDALDRVNSGLSEGYALDAVAVDIQDGLRALGEITGEISSDDILEKMFSSFCVGK